MLPSPPVRRTQDSGDLCCQVPRSHARMRHTWSQCIRGACNWNCKRGTRDADSTHTNNRCTHTGIQITDSPLQGHANSRARVYHQVSVLVQGAAALHTSQATTPGHSHVGFLSRRSATAKQCNDMHTTAHVDMRLLSLATFAPPSHAGGFDGTEDGSCLHNGTQAVSSIADGTKRLFDLAAAAYLHEHFQSCPLSP